MGLSSPAFLRMVIGVLSPIAAMEAASSLTLSALHARRLPRTSRSFMATFSIRADFDTLADVVPATRVGD
jgi:hypothetical protein